MQLSEINDDRNVGHVHSIPGVVEFGVEVLPGGQGSLVRVGGELDVATAPLLRMVAHGALAGQPGQVHLHLGEVTFFDSAGLDVLIGLRSAALLAPSVTASRPVRRLIELAGATHLFDLRQPTPPAPPGTEGEHRFGTRQQTYQRYGRHRADPR